MKEIISLVFVIFIVADILLALSANVALAAESGAKVFTDSGSGMAAGIKQISYEDYRDTSKNLRPGSGLLDNSEDYTLYEGEKMEDKIRRNHFVRVHASKTECFPGEAIVVTYKLYSRLNSRSALTKQPQLNGFAVYDMIDHISIHETTETLNGRRYKVHTLKKAQVVPLQTGKLELDPLELETTVRFIKRKAKSSRPGRQLDDVLEQLLMDEKAPEVTAKAKITGNILTISVKPLPELNQPAYFTGAVGSFAISADIPTSTITVNNPAVLELDVKGNGYTPLIGEPVICWPSGIDSFDVHSTEESQHETMPLQGRKTFSYTFVPARKGRFIMPAISFCFFDPSSKSYKVIETQPYEFQVFDEKAGIPQDKVTMPGDARVKFRAGSNTFLITKKLTAIVSTLFLLLVSYVGYQIHLFRRTIMSREKPERKNLDANTDVLKVDQREENRQLKTATELFRKGEHQAFCKELNNVLWDTLALKLRLPLSELNKQNIADKLKCKGWTNEMIGTMQAVLTDCERSLYISGYNSESNPEDNLQLADKLLAELEKL